MRRRRGGGLAATVLCCALHAGAAPPSGTPASRSPAIAASGKVDPAARAWIPPRWRLLRQAHGDLDGDGRADLVLVLEQDEPAHRRKDPHGTEVELNLNPRRLLVLLRDGEGYREVARADRLLPTESLAENTCQLDPLAAEGGGVKVARGTLKVDLHYWVSCGSYGVAHHTFTFRLEEGRMRLIGFDRLEFMRNSGAATRYSANFVTGRVKWSDFNMFEKGEPKARWKRVALPATYLEEVTPDCVGEGGAPKPWCG